MEKQITTNYHIEYPVDYGSKPCVCKVYFGKRYLVWKGKSLYKSIQGLADSIERHFRMQKSDTKDYLHHVCKHIKKTRCLKATVEVIDCDFVKEGSSVIDSLAMLKLEQTLIDKGLKADSCLNNNEMAYIPAWIDDSVVRKFMAYYNRKRK